MLVIATNSVWEVLSPSDVFSVLIHFIPLGTSTVFGTVPAPIIPVIHGRSGRKGDPCDGHTLSSTLPSIVETEEEEGIEEVIFVEAYQSDSEDEIKEEISLKSADVKSSTDSAPTNGRLDSKARSKTLTEDDYAVQGSMSFASAEEAIGSSAERQESNEQARYARIASILSDRLVRAAIAAGAVDNVSAVVVLFKGMFDP